VPEALDRQLQGGYSIPEAHTLQPFEFGQGTIELALNGGLVVKKILRRVFTDSRFR